MNKFSERLRDLMAEHEITQSSLSKSVGYTQAVISKWLAGKSIPNADVIFVLSKYFNVTAGYLIGTEE